MHAERPCGQRKQTYVTRTGWIYKIFANIIVRKVNINMHNNAI